MENLKQHRKEVRLPKFTIDILEQQAAKEGRSLKNYMEVVLMNKAQSIKGKQKPVVK